MTELTQELASDAQIKQLARFAADAAEKAVKEFVGLSKKGAQRVHGSPDFTARIREATTAALSDLSVTDKFADEERPSNYGYLSGYKKPKGVAEQTNRLREFFPGIGYADEKLAEQPLPAGAEGYAAIPRWQSIAPTYGEALQKVLDALSTAYGGRFYNYRKNQLGPDRLRQSNHSAAMWAQIGEQQKGNDILVVPWQFGIRHRGRSVRRALEVMMDSPGEFGPGAFAIGIMLLTHADRLKHYDDLWIDCAGDEYHDPRRSGRPFDLAPYFYFLDDKLKFDAVFVGYAHVYYGSASGFLVPQA